MSHGTQPAAQQPSSYADDMHDISVIDDLTQAYAAHPYFADGGKTADFTFAAG